jgi:hypothetical protein
MLAQRLKDVASKAGEAEIRDINLRAREAETRNKSGTAPYLFHTSGIDN